MGDAAGQRCPQAMRFQQERLGRFLLRGLLIGASTIAIVELLRSDWNGGICASLAWLVFLFVERQLPPKRMTPRPDCRRRSA